MTRRLLATLAFLCLLSVAGAAPEEAEPAFRRGVTISCWGWGAEWAEPGMPRAMQEIRALGAGWISFHPYAWIRRDGSLKHRGRRDDPTVIEPLKAAKRLGLKVFLKPHIGYWGSGFDWRGSIGFEDEASWKRFFDGYRDFIVTQAAMAESAGAALFCIGLEYKKTTHREKDWRRIIAAVRKVYKGRITYAANWDAYERVGFWDALDAIGIQAYFPVASSDNPRLAELETGWTATLARLKSYSEKHGKPIVFTELGYNRAAHAGRKPWDHAEGGEGADETKLRCMKVALRRIEAAPFITGVFLWKWFPTNRRMKRDFLLQYPAMTALLKRSWAKPAPSRGVRKSPPGPAPSKAH